MTSVGVKVLRYIQIIIKDKYIQLNIRLSENDDVRGGNVQEIRYANPRRKIFEKRKNSHKKKYVQMERKLCIGKACDVQPPGKQGNAYSLVAQKTLS